MRGRVERRRKRPNAPSRPRINLQIRAAQVRAARKRYREMAPVLNEQSLRHFVALETEALVAPVIENDGNF